MVTNSEFLAAVYGTLEDGQYGWTASFRSDPHNSPIEVWAGQVWVGAERQRALIDKRTQDNNYYSVARLRSEAKPQRLKAHFHELAVLVADDANIAALNGRPSFIIETSPGRHQVGAILDRENPNVRDPQLIDAVMAAMADAKLVNADRSGNNLVRYCRLPGGTNTKGGAAHPVRIIEWNPGQVLTVEDALSLFGLDLEAVTARAAPRPSGEPPVGTEHNELVRAIIRGDSYHDPLLKLAAKLVAAGTAGGQVVAHLRGLMEAVEDRSERWQARYAEIPRMVAGAERYRPGPVAPVTINLGGKDKAPAPPGELTPMDWGSLASVPPEPPVWRLEGWMPARTTTLLSANGGVGKSNLSLQLAAALALGAPFLGLDTEPRRVLVLSAEDEARTVHFRLGNICEDLGVGLEALAGRLTAYDLTTADCVLWKDGVPTPRMQWLADTVERHQAEVVILDNASDVFTANENDRAEVRGFMRCLNLIAHHSGAAVLLLAHVDKASVRAGAGQDTNSTFSGSTAWNNSARSRWAMTRDNDVVTLRHEKCNMGPLQGEMRLEFDPAAKVFRRFGQVASAAAARQLLRNSQRVEILRMVQRASNAGLPIALSTRSPNAAHTKLSRMSGYPKTLKRAELHAELEAMVLEGLIEEREGRNTHRNKVSTLVLTPAGDRLLGEG